MQVVWKVTSAWCGVEDQQWQENDKKAQIGGHREVSDEQAHQHDISLIADQIFKSQTSGLGQAVQGKVGTIAILQEFGLWIVIV